jgi:crossover junction endodeoxyribonuclease RuvC
MAKKRTKNKNGKRIILGIDPGTTMGFGLIRVINKNGVLQLNELQLSKYDNHYLF